jgi:membrane-associated phospholipid phosphatase
MILFWNPTLNAVFNAVCLCLVAGFVVFCCIPPLHVPARQLLQPFAIYHVESGLYWVTLLQTKYRTRAVTIIADSLCQSVSVGFYGVSLPLIIWIKPPLGIDLTMLMALTQYIGNAIKDLVSAPRPAGLEYADVRCHIAQTSTNAKEKQKNAAEYGLPSSHAMNSLAFNFYVVLALHKGGALRDEMAVYWYMAVVMFVSIVALSRVYLGLHTPIDILGGAVAGLTVVTAYYTMQEAGILHRWVYGVGDGLTRTAFAAAGFACLILLRLHPTPESHTPSYEYSTSFIGVAFGVFCGTRARNEGPEEMRGLASPDMLIIGLIVLALSKIVAKAIFSIVLPFLYRKFFPKQIRRLWQPPVVGLETRKEDGIKKTQDGRDADVDATVRFFSYATIGISASYVVPKFLFAL